MKELIKLFGIKTFIEKHIESREASMIKHQKQNDLRFRQEIDLQAHLMFLDWQHEQTELKAHNNNPWYIPIRIERQVGICYHVDHEPTAKYLRVNTSKLILEKFEELKSKA